jgi:hypothetical protein
MARPREQDRSRVRDKLVHVRATKNQLQAWKEEAKRMGLTLSQWLRMVGDRDARM